MGGGYILIPLCSYVNKTYLNPFLLSFFVAVFSFALQLLSFLFSSSNFNPSALVRTQDEPFSFSVRSLGGGEGSVNSFSNTLLGLATAATLVAVDLDLSWL